jgi:hypothetical protein
MQTIPGILKIGRVALLGGTVAALAAPSMARADHKSEIRPGGNFRAAVRIGLGQRTERVWVPPVYEERQRVIHTEPVYETRVRQVWCPPEYEERWVSVEVPPVVERCRVPIVDRFGRTVGYRWVEKVVRPACRERRLQRVLVREGCYKNITEQVLMREGCERVITERVCSRAGYYAEVPCDDGYGRPSLGVSFSYRGR